MPAERRQVKSAAPGAAVIEQVTTAQHGQRPAVDRGRQEHHCPRLLPRTVVFPVRIASQAILYPNPSGERTVSAGGRREYFRPGLCREVGEGQAEPELGAGNGGLPAPGEGCPDHGRDQGRTDDQAGPGGHD